jgi:hypothetical protein
MVDRATDPDRAGRDADYFAAIEKHFVALRGSPAFITPREWQLILDWHQRNIPLRVVREALDEAFLRLAKRTRIGPPRRRPYRLSYCRQPVEVAYRRFREALLGSPEGARQSPEELRAELAHYLGGLERALRVASLSLEATAPELARLLVDAAAGIAAAAGTLQQAFGLSSIEAELEARDAEILRVAEATLGGGEAGRLREQAEAQFAAYRERMPPEVYRSAVESAYLKRLRARFGLPQLDLSSW